MYKKNKVFCFFRAVVSCFLLLVSSIVLAGNTLPKDRLDIPASFSTQVDRSVKLSVDSLASTVAAVGLRGEVVISTDEAGSFTQSTFPLSSDLTTVKFTDDQSLWVLGHDAVMLRSTDLGKTWQRILDGRSTLSLLSDFYEKKSASGDENAAQILRDINRTVATSTTPDVLPYPFFDISINPQGVGFATGAFGLLLKTQDGGNSWEPWMDRADNGWGYHIYSVQQFDNDVYLAGERGFLRHFNNDSGQFERIETPFDGTYFGVYADSDVLQIYGLRGRVYSSTDKGITWGNIELDTDSTIVSLVISESGLFIYATQKGELFVSSDQGQNAVIADVDTKGEFLSATLIGKNKLALAQYGGVHVVLLSSLLN